MSNELALMMKNKVEDKAFRVAYALNMCTVSVSQIVDYEDINILEQEYNAILNNLNLELMPKDEALLAILKQLLDTITFFRISEGDKRFIEREYEQKVKNAIWASVPNFGMIFTGGVSPASIALSLASQVGIGYMNYRAHKAEYRLEKEKEYWKLQRTAIEQFNALKRELFTTAWRLADAYNFPDNYRLTENQISQYNRILSDPDDMRRYERLEYVKENFFAYPPYWYFLGHAANCIYMDERYALETRQYYAEKAKEFYQIYWEFKKINILREDQIMASCALEYIDLLNPENDREKISSLLSDAIKVSSNAEDVLQICAFSYLKIGDNVGAAKVFRHLVNERYNTVLNAQILSQLYVSDYLSGNNMEVKREYETLASRVDTRYLFPFPNSDNGDKDALTEEFFEMQKAILVKGFEGLCRLMFQKYVISLNELLPCPKSEPQDKSYYSNDQYALKMRREGMKGYLSESSKIGNSYKNKLRDMEVQYGIVNELNRVLVSIEKMQAFFDVVDIQNIINVANKVMVDYRGTVNELQKEAKEGRMTFVNYEKTEVMFDEVIRNIFRYVLSYGKKYISTVSSMVEIAEIEECLLKVCEIEELPITILSANNFESTLVAQISTTQSKFSMGIFGERAFVDQELIERRVNVAAVIKEHAMDLLIKDGTKSKKKANIFINGNMAFDEYVKKDKYKKLYEGSKSKIAAFIVDEYSHCDLILTSVGVFVKRYSKIGCKLELSDLIPYEKIEISNDDTLIFNGAEYTNPSLNIIEFYKMIRDICELQNR